jgi:hypothetical protein
MCLNTKEAYHGVTYSFLLLGCLLTDGIHVEQDAIFSELDTATPRAIAHIFGFPVK